MTNATPPALAVTPTLPVLTFNFEQLKAWASGIAEHYSGLIVTEDGVTEAKRDMAEINKAKAAVDAARKETVRQVSEPVRAFEAQVKEVCGIFDQAYAKLAEQVKVFEDARRDEKRVIVEGLIEEAVNGLCPSDSVSLPDIPMQDKWLNKTASIKSIREDIAVIISRHIEEEQRKAALEQARQDRAAAIETHVKTLNQQYGFDQPVARFLHGQEVDLNTPLADVLKRISGIFDYEREQQAKKTVCVSPVSNKTDCVAETAKSATQTPMVQTRAMSIVLEYDVANEAQVEDCLDCLESLCVGFGRRTR